MNGSGKTRSRTMRLIRVHSRNGTEDMVYENAPIPRPGSGELLVRVGATGITPTELTWTSTFTRRDGTERLPIIPGFDFSGTVTEIGPGGSDFDIGDEVYGLLDFWRDGAAAEYVVAVAKEIALKPQSADHVRAASVPLSGLTAWQALFDHARLESGARVLIHGAAGGVGTYACQLAHGRGAHVIGTASGGNAGFLNDLGVEEVVDYGRERFEGRVDKVDVVLDTVGGEVLERSWGVVRRGGMLVTIAGEVSAERAAKLGIQAADMLVTPNRSELVELARRIDSGALRPVVESVYPLDSAREAYERGAKGHNRGKTVLRVSADSASPGLRPVGGVQ